MKFLIILIWVLLIVSCDNKTKIVTNNSMPDQPEPVPLATDSVLTFKYHVNFIHPNISNESDRQIDLLYNGVNNYLGGHKNPKIEFRTECMPCEPIQEYIGGLLFAKRLLITNDKIKFYKNDFDIPDNYNRIKLHSDRERKITKFKYSDGKGSINYLGISCNDADFNKVRLKYPSGEIVVDSLINASFFEYDINKDGQKEQYLLGSRSCSQEFVILRIRKQDDIN